MPCCHGDGMHCPAHLVIHIVEVRVDSTPPHLVEDGAVRTAHAKRQALSLAFANTGTSHWRKQPMNKLTMMAAMNNITPYPSSTATPATFMYSVHHHSVLYRPDMKYLTFVYRPYIDLTLDPIYLTFEFIAIRLMQR